MWQFHFFLLCSCCFRRDEQDRRVCDSKEGTLFFIGRGAKAHRISLWRHREGRKDFSNEVWRTRNRWADAPTADIRHYNMDWRHKNEPFILKHASAAANLHNFHSSAVRRASVRTLTGNIWSFWWEFQYVRVWGQLLPQCAKTKSV